MTNEFRQWLKIKKYRYAMFLKNMPAAQQAVVVGRIWHRRLWHRAIPDSLEIGVTYRCQLECGHCGVSGQDKPGGTELNISEITSLIRKAQKLGIYFVIFSGGEPFMREDLMDMVRYASGRGCMIALSTNGLGITPEKAEQLKRHHVSFLNVSIDSPRAGTHDALRGRKGCFAETREKIRMLRQKGIPVIISTYITKENIQADPLSEMIRLARTWDAQGVRVLLGAASGKWQGCLSDIVSPEEKKYVARFLDPCYVFVEGVCNTFTECNALLKKLFYVSPYGDVQPCSFVPMAFGNTREEDLSQIWERMTRHGLYGEFDSGECLMRNQAFVSKYRI